MRPPETAIILTVLPSAGYQYIREFSESPINVPNSAEWATAEPYVLGTWGRSTASEVD